MRSTVLRTCMAMKPSSVTFYDSIGDVTDSATAASHHRETRHMAGPTVTAPQFIRVGRTAGR